MTRIHPRQQNVIRPTQENISLICKRKNDNGRKITTTGV